MANTCNNSIYFYGKDLSKIKEIIADAIRTNDKLQQGWLPEFAKPEHCLARYFFDVCINHVTEGEELAVSCWTKWAPPLEELVAICKEANVSCLCLYDELGFLIYGQFQYDVSTDTQKDISLTDEDFDRVQEDKESDVYIFDGEVVESCYTAYAEILDQKLEKENQLTI